MTRDGRARQKAARLEAKGWQAAMRAATAANPVGRAAIKAGETASRAWRLAAAIRAAIADRAAAAGRETRKKRLAREWWRKGAA